jgi:hypothetical protein
MKYLFDADAFLIFKPTRDLRFPGVPIEAFPRLLRSCHIQLGRIKPPSLVAAIPYHCFGPKLIAVSFKGVDVDDSTLDGPETPAASFIL